MHFNLGSMHRLPPDMIPELLKYMYSEQEQEGRLLFTRYRVHLRVVLGSKLRYPFFSEKYKHRVS